MKSIQTIRLQKRYDEIFCKTEESPTWQAICREVFGKYVGQLSFTPVTQVNLLAEKLHIVSRSHVLELASGTGGLSLYLVKLTGCRLTGLDASAVAVKIANKQAMLQELAQHARFEVGTLPELPYQDRSFDLVISTDSVYSVADKTALFCSSYRVLRPGGYLGFYTLYKRRKFLAESGMCAQASSWFPVQPYSKLLEKVGFEGILRIDLTKDLIRLTKHWAEAMQENKASLDKELGKKITKVLLADVGTAWALASEGYAGRALFKAQKPCKTPHQNVSAQSDTHMVMRHKL